MPGAHIANGSFIAAGAVVPNKKFNENSYLAGIPAKSMELVKSKPLQELESAPMVAFLLGKKSKLKQGAQLLASTLGMPQITVISAGQKIPKSVQIIICLDENCLVPENIKQVWQISSGNISLKPKENLRLSLIENDDIICPNEITYDIAFNGFSEKPTLVNIASSHLFRAINAYLKGTKDMRDNGKNDWALSLLAAYSSDKLDDSRWDNYLAPISQEFIDKSISANNWRSKQSLLEEILKDAVKDEKNEKLNSLFFNNEKPANFASFKQLFITKAWILPAFIWFNKDKNLKLCNEIINYLTPYMNNAQRLASLGLSHKFLANNAKAKSILQTLISAKWLAPNSSLIKNNPNAKTIDRHPTLVAFLVSQLIESDDYFNLLDTKSKPIKLIWSGFTPNKTKQKTASDSLDLYDEKTNKFSKALFENWLKFQQLPKIKKGHFFLSDINYHRTCQALEKIWKEMIVNSLLKCDLPAIQIKPWPTNYDWAISFRYDVDRQVTSKDVRNIVRIQKQWLNSSCGSWYYLAGATHNKKTENLLRGWNQEKAHHSRLSNESEAKGKGVSAHSAADSQYWRGYETIKGHQQSGAIYSEAMLSSFLLPRPAFFGDDPSEIWLTPLHYPLEGSTSEENLEYFDKNYDSFKQQITGGGLVIIGSHPDCNQDILDKLLARENLEKAWGVPVNRAVDRIKSLFAVGNITTHSRLDDEERNIYLLSNNTIADVVIEILYPGEKKWHKQSLQFQAGVARSLDVKPKTNLKD